MIHGPTLDENHLNADNYHDGMDIHDDMDVADAGFGHHGRGHGSEEGDLADEESDDLLDDDLMDKISSSPSIDDGKHLTRGHICGMVRRAALAAVQCSHVPRSSPNFQMHMAYIE
jgi:hypothetical protein